MWRRYWWVDYMCVPQSDPEATMTAIFSLPHYVKCCGTFVALLDDAHPEVRSKKNGWVDDLTINGDKRALFNASAANRNGVGCVEECYLGTKKICRKITLLPKSKARVLGAKRPERLHPQITSSYPGTL